MLLLNEALAVIDELGAPEHMSKEQWFEFLEDLIEELEARRDATQRELDELNEEDDDANAN